MKTLFAIASSFLFMACSEGGTGVNDDDGGGGPTPDMAGVTSHDMAGVVSHDMAGMVTHDMAMGQKGTVGPTGGTVSRLFFGVTGDTRPANCDDVANYPTQTITQIFSDMNTAGVQFALATGDHQYVCSG